MLIKRKEKYMTGFENLILIHTDKVRNYEGQVPYCPVTESWLTELAKIGFNGEIKYNIYRIPGTPNILISPIMQENKIA